MSVMLSAVMLSVIWLRVAAPMKKHFDVLKLTVEKDPDVIINYYPWHVLQNFLRQLTIPYL
jgi:hypothetical protein